MAGQKGIALHYLTRADEQENKNLISWALKLENSFKYLAAVEGIS